MKTLQDIKDDLKQAILFYTIEEVAQRLNLSTKSIRRWVRSGDLAAHRFGRSLRIAESDLKNFLERRRMP